MATDNSYINALAGAVVTVVLAFIPFSPLLGGAVAGFLERRDGARVGTISGVFAAVPLFLLVLLVASIVAFVPAVPAGAEALVAVASIVAFGLLLYVVVPSAVGGVVGVYLGEEFVERRGADVGDTDR